MSVMGVCAPMSFLSSSAVLVSSDPSVMAIHDRWIAAKCSVLHAMQHIVHRARGRRILSAQLTL